MAKTVEESYPYLWHYTTAIGLSGILTSQQLWATNIDYLNDAEEFTGFLDKRLRSLIVDGVKAGLEELETTSWGQQQIEAFGGKEAAEIAHAQSLFKSVRAVTLTLRPYVTSFCHPASDAISNDGQLSQWRGYGTDGGYAIVLDTRRLNQLLEQEDREFYFSLCHWGDVDYFDNATSSNILHDETVEWQNKIRDSVARHLVKQTTDLGGELFEPVLALSTRHKHIGFYEESEVRIAAFLPDDTLMSEARSEGEKRLRKPIHFVPRRGVLVPYIALFGNRNIFNGRLPIQRIVVGPHPEKHKRQRAVQMLLTEMKIDADVTVSTIPYLGVS